MQKKQWRIKNIDNAKYLGALNFQASDGEYHSFEILDTTKYLVFGSPTNNSFLQSGYIKRDDCETLDETLQELLIELETYYNDGSNYVSRIICNERM